MRLLMIRHGDPDYVHDTLTPKGDREAQLLAETLAGEHIDRIYKSPLGRAAKTASYTEKKIGITGETREWLQEFPSLLNINGNKKLQAAYPDAWKNDDGTFGDRIFWDMLPGHMAEDDDYYDNQAWRVSEEARLSTLDDMYDKVTGGLDELLAEYGYRRSGRNYAVERENTMTIALFCHFGVQCVLLSHLWNCSPYLLWHGTCMQPSSVTELVTEEREQGIASFRALRIGDISHLKIGHEEPSFMGRFCEVYSDMSQRH